MKDMKDLKRPYIMSGERNELDPDTYCHPDVKCLRSYAFRLEDEIANLQSLIEGYKTGKIPT